MVNYTDYKIMANNISYWLIKNEKKIKTRKEYNLAGKEKKSLAEIKKTILKSKDTANNWGRKFLEAAVVDNKDTSLFPKYVAYKGRQYTKAEYIYMAKYVINWWKQKPGKAPTTIPIKKEDSKKKSKILNPYMTEKGCAGMGQCTPYNCACNSLQQAFYRLTGIKVPESTIAKWAGTTSAGTSHQGIATAVAMFNKTYNKNVKLEWFNFSELGKNSNERWNKVNEFIKKGALFFHLCYRGPNGVGHYEVPYGIGEVLRILNSLGDRCGNGTYCGYMETRSRSTQEWYISGISQKSVAVLVNG